MRAIAGRLDGLVREHAHRSRSAVSGSGAGGHLGPVAEHRAGPLHARRGALGGCCHVELLLHISIERIRSSADARDLLRHGIKRAARRILALDDGKGFKNCTHLVVSFEVVTTPRRVTTCQPCQPKFQFLRLASFRGALVPYGGGVREGPAPLAVSLRLPFRDPLAAVGHSP